MCHIEDYQKNFDLLQSTNPGNGICCKNQVATGVCSDSYPDLHCSTPSYLSSSELATHSHKSIFTPANRNYQMFAFCSGNNNKICGIPQADGGDGEDVNFHVHAEAERAVTISTNQMKYVEIFNNEKQIFEKKYDACYYMVKRSKRMEGERGNCYLNLKIDVMDNMNVYIYGGPNRDEATIPIVPNNGQAIVG